MTACTCPHCHAELDMKPLIGAYIAAGGAWSRSKFTPCAKCRRELKQRERIRPCPGCGFNNYRHVRAERLAISGNIGTMRQSDGKETKG